MDLCRSFFINNVYAYCPGDAGWLVIDGWKDCDWERRLAVGNLFLYGKTGLVVWSQTGKFIYFVNTCKSRS